MWYKNWESPQEWKVWRGMFQAGWAPSVSFTGRKAQSPVNTQEVPFDYFLYSDKNGKFTLYKAVTFSFLFFEWGDQKYLRQYCYWVKVFLKWPGCNARLNCSSLGILFKINVDLSNFGECTFHDECRIQMEGDVFTNIAFPSNTLNAGGHLMIWQVRDEGR